MQRALDAAREAGAAGEVPVGATIVRDGEILAVAANAPRRLNDPTAHAEMLAIRAAAQKLGTDRLSGCTLYVTLEPCAMCAGAIALARLDRVVYAAPDAKGGGVRHGARVFDQPTCHHRPEVIDGVGEDEAAALLRGFFAARR